jgi:hypothetical protein
VAVEPPSGAEVCADHRAREAAVRATLLGRFQRTVRGSHVEVSFDCDPNTQPNQIWLETGDGHGGSLAVWHITLEKDDDKELRILGFVHHRPWATYDEYSYEVADRFETGMARGTVPLTAVRTALEIARPALTARVREIRAPEAGLFAQSVTFGSGDFHALVRTADGVNALERSYTGYPGSEGQSAYLGLVLAMETLNPLVEKIAVVPASPSKAERDMFVVRFVSAASKFYDASAWWVRERYVRLAGRLGTTALVPILLEDLRRGLADLHKERENLERATQVDDAERARRTRSFAQSRLNDTINAVVRLTGYDRRSDAGAPRASDEVARELIACAPKGAAHRTRP